MNRALLWVERTRPVQDVLVACAVGVGVPVAVSTGDLVGASLLMVAGVAHRLVGRAL